MIHSNSTIAAGLATAFVTGPWREDDLVERGCQVLGRLDRWLQPLVQRILREFDNGRRPPQQVLQKFIFRDQRFVEACHKRKPSLRHPSGLPPVMCPILAAELWQVPALTNTASLADWLEISPAELDWFADVRFLEYRTCRGRLRHYHYRPLTKQFGHIRLIEAPKTRLKCIQRQILTDILDQIPVHSAAHGFCKGRGTKSFAACHVDQQVVVRLDLHDFFPSIRVPRVQAVFHSLGYPEPVSNLLTGLCTNRTPLAIWEPLPIPHEQKLAATRLYAEPHLPQGAPTSPALANLCCYRLDCRLTALAQAADAVYSRYADDLAFSGGSEFARSAHRFRLHASTIAMEEGHHVHLRKSKVMRQGVQQRLAGVVVNQVTNVPRRDFDRLKAILVNSVRHGPASQNRDGLTDFRAHLRGRVAHVQQLNPARGERLRRLFDQIVW